VLIYSSSTVNHAAASLLAGALALFFAGVARRRPGARWVPWLLLGGGAFIALLKSTNAIAIVAVALLLLWESMRARPAGSSWRDGVRPWLRTGGALLLGGALAVCTWAIITRSRATIEPSEIGIYADALHLDRLEPFLIFRELSGTFSPGAGAYVAPFLASGNQAPFIALGPGLLLAAGFAWIFVKQREWPHVLGAAALIAIAAVGFVLGVAFFFLYRADPSLNGRYVLSATPVLALALAGAARGRPATIGLWAFSLAFLGFQIQALV
jgi:protein-S-isoprenylcysteine O-methyltransferase Ste14